MLANNIPLDISKQLCLHLQWSHVLPEYPSAQWHTTVFVASLSQTPPLWQGFGSQGWDGLDSEIKSNKN